MKHSPSVNGSSNVSGGQGQGLGGGGPMDNDEYSGLQYSGTAPAASNSSQD